MFAHKEMAAILFSHLVVDDFFLYEIFRSKKTTSRSNFSLFLPRDTDEYSSL